MWHFVYVLKNLKSEQYVGNSDDLNRRLKEHNAGYVSATVDGRPWRIEWFCSFKTKKEAVAFEKYLKSGSGTTFRHRRLVPLS